MSVLVDEIVYFKTIPAPTNRQRKLPTALTTHPTPTCNPTTATMTTVNKLIEAFPIQALTKITGIPTYRTIKTANNELSKNAATVPTTHGSNTLGHVAITVLPTIYATLSPTPFTVPTAPFAPNLTGMNGPHISTAIGTFDKAKADSAEYGSEINKEQWINIVTGQQ